jgi:hypothetical protein
MDKEFEDLKLETKGEKRKGIMSKITIKRDEGGGA